MMETSFDEGAASAPENLEFSRTFDTSNLGRAAKNLTLSANAAECVALAQRFDLIEIRSFTVTLRIVRSGKGGLIRVTGDLCADVVQECVVTLEPVEARVEEPVQLRFAPTLDASLGDGNRADSKIDLEIEYEEEDPPEPMVGDIIELGEPLSQLLALGLDPYPQAPDAEATGWRRDDAGDDELSAAEMDRENPFSVLAALKKETE